MDILKLPVQKPHGKITHTGIQMQFPGVPWDFRGKCEAFKNRGTWISSPGSLWKITEVSELVTLKECARVSLPTCFRHPLDWKVNSQPFLLHLLRTPLSPF